MGRSTIWNAVRLVARDNSYHPVKEYLESLHWDGVERIGTWLEIYAKAKDELNSSPQYRSLVGKSFLISAVARIYQPGCQADNMLVLEGEQGWFKTTLFRVLFDPWFTDNLPTMTTKDAQIALMGKWCVLLDEMETWSKADHPIAKQFISRCVEKFRLPYDKFESEYPRQCVFAGTLNPVAGFLSDPAGNRRYWNATLTDKVDIVALTRDRNQLWAEALRCYQSDEYALRCCASVSTFLAISRAAFSTLKASKP
jgi:predicted P-loop ATPase